MRKRHKATPWAFSQLLAALALLPAALPAQVAVDEDGNVLSTYEAGQESSATGNEEIPLLSAVDLEELVGPIALYPDDLLAVVLPASAYPLQIVDAARFLETVKSDPTLKPNPEWDDSVVALLNYPEVVKLLNDDIDWTWRLGEAVVAQQADVVATIEAFRDRAYAAGNLKSDDYQNVTHENGVIEITPVSEDVIYVPYYEPDRVVVYQPRPVYYYYPRAYPVYYYPYSSAYRFSDYGFWGVTTAFRIGWFSDSLSVFHHSYYGHPYFGRQYRDRWWYRRPTINRHNVIYFGGNTNVRINRYYGGDRWRPRHDRREYVDQRRVTRARSKRIAPRRHPDGNFPRVESRRIGSDAVRRTDIARQDNRRQTTTARSERSRAARDPITFRQRPKSPKAIRRDAATERQPNVTQQRASRDAEASRRAENLQLRARVEPREARISTKRSNAIKLRQRSESRQSLPGPSTSRPNRSESLTTTARTAPVARNARRVESAAGIRNRPPEAVARTTRRVESAPKIQARRSEARVRTVEKRPSTAASRATPKARQAPTREVQRKSLGTQRKSGSVQRKRLN